MRRATGSEIFERIAKDARRLLPKRAGPSRTSRAGRSHSIDGKAGVGTHLHAVRHSVDQLRRYEGAGRRSAGAGSAQSPVSAFTVVEIRSSAACMSTSTIPSYSLKRDVLAVSCASRVEGSRRRGGSAIALASRRSVDATRFVER